MKTYNLKSMPKANCKVIIYEDDGCFYVGLRSYNTNVLWLELHPGYHGQASWIEVHSNGTWSTTTARHINRFTKEFLGENYYHKIKIALGFNSYSHYGSYVLCDVIEEIDILQKFCKTRNAYRNA